jgi:hypothetical protein
MGIVGAIGVDKVKYITLFCETRQKVVREKGMGEIIVVKSSDAVPQAITYFSIVVLQRTATVFRYEHVSSI